MWEYAEIVSEWARRLGRRRSFLALRLRRGCRGLPWQVVGLRLARLCAWSGFAAALTLIFVLPILQHHRLHARRNVKLTLPTVLSQPELVAINPPPAKVEESVVLASAIGELPAKPATDENLLLLPSDRPLRLVRLELAQGAMVRAEQDRATVELPAGGVLVESPDVTFENIDFKLSEGVAEGLVEPVLLRIAASGVTFRNCTFAGGSRAIAIVWQSESPPEDWAQVSQLVLETTRFLDCDVALKVAQSGDARVRFDCATATNASALVRLERFPRAAEKFTLDVKCSALEQTSLLVCGQPDWESIGQVRIQSENSVVIPAAERSALVFESLADVSPALAHFEWEGRNCQLAVDCAVAVWDQGEGEYAPLEEERLEISGVMRTAAPAEPEQSAPEVEDQKPEPEVQ